VEIKLTHTHLQLCLTGLNKAGNASGVKCAESSEGVTAADTAKSTLHISPQMSLDEAMAEVRRYLDATGATHRGAPQSQVAGGTGLAQPRQFTLLGSSIARLSQASARYGVIEPDGKGGVAGSYLKRLIRKAVGWYSRPAQEFDHTVIEALEQTRLDMQGLQHQIVALASDRSRQTGQAELLRSMIELLLANIVAVQSLRQALQEQQPGLQPRFEELLSRFEDELAEVKTALLEQLPGGSPDK
jgi:hypothetical protein